jgi:hypothetical protein
VCVEREVRTVIVIVGRPMIEFDAYGEESVKGGREVEGEIAVVCRGREVEGRAVRGWGVL